MGHLKNLLSWGERGGERGRRLVPSVSFSA